MSVAATASRLAHDLVDAAAGPRLSILHFHRVRAVADPLFPDEPDAARFDALLRRLATSFRVLGLGAAVDAMAERRLPRRALAITFDDGYADNAEVALPLLSRHGLRATFFIASGFLDGAGCMWNDALIEAVRAARGDAADLGDLGLGHRPLAGVADRRRLVDALIDRAKYLDADRRDAFVDAVRQRLGVGAAPPPLMLSTRQVRALHAAGMEIGAHTMRHPILATLDDAACEREIEGGRRRLETIVDAAVDLFAYPNGKPGRDYGRRDVALVDKLGFRAAVSTAPGTAAAGADRLQLPRYTPWGRTPAVWSARLLRNRLRRRIDTV